MLHLQHESVRFENAPALPGAANNLSFQTRSVVCRAALRALRNTAPPLRPTGVKGVYLKHELHDKLIEHRRYIRTRGEDMPEIQNRKWKGAKQS